ncbi:isochorismatase family protein [Pseudomonas mosselii]|uniref:Isochorismatase family protein n=1 Tax=Pseudomonas mosselii TaxID=78327 RepID=A0ABX9AV36_9PSED|nr:isochorismatase family protein [Pseudomonas mosselii]MCU9531607.1 isochorismatase family protein [Pseudomonas mosselii]MCU9538875.1 isochorismatase family protein [Pseudomonas mosselii]MCU9543255.1 isochorismatase family protein [Pseudomonas mosselii]MCU9550556.1 isochorismatase family protein [Pseudomonas mosselii]QZP24903.1 isochorismatase family protein [Pseudomonas mosselii]
MSAEPIPRAEALLLVDVQCAFMEGADAVPGHLALQASIARLLARARQAGVPVIFLQNDGAPDTPDAPHTAGWQLYFSAGRGEYVLFKTEDDGFVETGLQALLHELGVQCLALCGLLSEMCLAATARAALQRGFEVLLAHDAHATYDVPPGPGGSPGVSAALAARAAEWSLGDEVVVLPDVEAVAFARFSQSDPDRVWPQGGPDDHASAPAQPRRRRFPPHR